MRGVVMLASRVGEQTKKKTGDTIMVLWCFGATTVSTVARRRLRKTSRRVHALLHQKRIFNCFPQCIHIAKVFPCPLNEHTRRALPSFCTCIWCSVGLFDTTNDHSYHFAVGALKAR